jgi:transcriptional regulator with XRE-family HTH domain
MLIASSSKKRSAPVFPKNQRVLAQLGENIKLASKRRKYTQSLIAERTGLSRLTIRKIEQGDPTVSMGHYVSVLSVLGLVGDFARVASDDELGRKLQDIKLLGK